MILNERNKKLFKRFINRIKRDYKDTNIKVEVQQVWEIGYYITLINNNKKVVIGLSSDENIKGNNMDLIFNDDKKLNWLEQHFNRIYKSTIGVAHYNLTK